MWELKFDKLFDNNKFQVWHTLGDRYSPLSTFVPPVLDAIAISNEPCVTAFFGEGLTDPLIQHHAKWVNLAEALPLDGAVTLMWNRAFRYWCISDSLRPNHQWNMKSRIFQLDIDEEQSVDFLTGDVVFLLEGEVSIDGGNGLAAPYYHEFTQNITRTIKGNIPSIVVGIRSEAL